MKLVKSLMLSSAAGIIAMSGAQAADLPVKAKAVEYVRICSLYGAGFYYIPGTDTCIRLGGYLRAEVIANSNSDWAGPNNGAGGANNRFTNGYTWRGRNDIFIDTRTATEYGVVRSYGEMTLSWTDDTYSGIGNGSTVSTLPGRSPAPGNASGGNVALGALGVYYAYIQFAGFTMGRRSRSSALPGRTTRATTSTASSVAAVPLLASTSSPTPRSSATASVRRPRFRIRSNTSRRVWLTLALQ